MKITLPTGKRRRSDFPALLGRWLLGGLFLYLGLSKVLHSAVFGRLVREQFMITDPFLSGLIVTTAPWLEVLYGLLLLTGIARNFAALLARWWLGVVFIFMGMHKALPHPEAFLKLVRQYDLVTSPVLLNSIGAALPWFEVFCGLLLLAGIAVRGAALNVVVMLVPFTLMVLKRALALAATSGIPFCAVKFDCGCGAGEVFICHKLVENTVLLLLAALLLTGRGRPLCLRFSLFREKEDASGHPSQPGDKLPQGA
jgi:uncharacterized membrane protein YphA (DoxX/SURF4 family)